MSKRRVAGVVDVAEAAGVSAATISRCFYTPERVGGRSRNRIAEAIRYPDCLRKRVAGSLHNRQAGAVGLVVRNVDNAIFAEMIEVFSGRLRNHDFTVLIASHGYDPGLALQLVQPCLSAVPMRWRLSDSIINPKPLPCLGAVQSRRCCPGIATAPASNPVSGSTTSRPVGW